ncbi:signal peptidase I [bacterium]|nr:MAG: signal peptidase I [bacterium]
MKKEKILSEIRSYLTAILFVLFLRAFFIQTFHVPTGSMEDTILVGDFLMVNRFVFGMKIPFTDKYFVRFSYPRRGDIIVFRYPLGRANFVKRCVGLSGDTIEIRHKILYVNGKRMEEPYVKHIDPREFPHINDVQPMPQEMYQKFWENREFKRTALVRDNFGPVVVPEGCVFGLGDNRDNSDDSRFWGPIPINYISGVPIFIYWSQKKEIPAYKLFQKIRWGRIGKVIKWRVDNGKKIR